MRVHDGAAEPALVANGLAVRGAPPLESTTRCVTVGAADEAVNTVRI